MRYLILSGRFGQGHNSVAESLKEELLKKERNQIYVVDFIDYIFPHINKFIYGGFNFLVGKCSMIYNMFNKALSKNNKAPLKEIMINRIDTLITEYKPDVIISVLPVASGYISAYKKYTGKKLTLYTFTTDIYVNKEWITEYTDKYFVASYETLQCLIDQGVPKNKIFVVGIPVKNEFQNHFTSNHKKEILIMAGGLGLLPNIHSVLNYLEKSKNTNTTIITGNNIKLYNKLKTKYKHIKCIGYTDEVYQYLNKSDLILTKSGGITLFEAIKSETPMLVIKPFLSQETGNAKFIEKNNIGKVVWNNKFLLKELINLLNNEDEQKSMRLNLFKIKSHLQSVENLL